MIATGFPDDDLLSEGWLVTELRRCKVCECTDIYYKTIDNGNYKPDDFQYLCHTCGVKWTVPGTEINP
jgi:hypothetical protein